MNMSEEDVVNPNKALWLTIILIIFVVAVFMLILLLPPSGIPPETTETPALATATVERMQEEEEEAVTIVVIGGEVGAVEYGYGFEGGVLASPGPDIRVRVGVPVTIVFKNVGNLPHTLAITEEKRFDAEPLWGVQLGTPTRPVGPGEESMITFTPNKAGEYYYVCQVPGHIELGMWGKLIAEE